MKSSFQVTIDKKGRSDNLFSVLLSILPKIFFIKNIFKNNVAKIKKLWYNISVLRLCLEANTATGCEIRPYQPGN